MIKTRCWMNIVMCSSSFFVCIKHDINLVGINATYMYFLISVVKPQAVSSDNRYKDK